MDRKSPRQFLTCGASDMRLNELGIIVTGAAKGMGAYFCQQLASAGAHVAAGDIDSEGLQQLARDSSGLPGSVHIRSLDVTAEQDTGSFVEWAASTLTSLNAVVSNAGILRDGLLVKRDRNSGKIITMSRSDWQNVIDVNLTGATWIVRDAVARMATDRIEAGVVVSMSSLSRHGNRGQSNYVAAKAALAANTATWAREFAPFGIRVGALAPGIIETPMTDEMNPKARQVMIDNIPVGRIGKPHDVWLGLKFIIENDYFTGRCIDIDGGLHMP